MPTAIERLTITPAEGAEIVGMSERRFRDEARAGRIPHIRNGNRMLFVRAALEQWLVEQAFASLRPAPAPSPQPVPSRVRTRRRTPKAA